MPNKILITGVAGFIGSNLAARLLLEGHEVVGVDNLAYGLKENIPDGVEFYPLDIRDDREIQEILQIYETIGVAAKVHTDLFTPKLAKSTICLCGDVCLIEFYTVPKMNWKLVLKRLLDIGISSLLLVIRSPFFMIISILVKSTSKGPIFYPWKVVGKNNREFTGYKFRTVVENADAVKETLSARNQMKGPVFKMKTDPRITHLGKWLRKFSLDELPQLWSVLKGDMSLVGPRPPVKLSSSGLTFGSVEK